MKPNQAVKVLDHNGNLVEQGRVSKILAFRGSERAPIDEAEAGDIVAIAGCPDVTVGLTFADPANPKALPPLTVDEPTISMDFLVNDSPFAGKDGGIFLTSRQLRERLEREKETNVGLRIEEQGNSGVSPKTQRIQTC